MSMNENQKNQTKYRNNKDIFVLFELNKNDFNFNLFCDSSNRFNIR
jgi:hypothetical protein